MTQLNLTKPIAFFDLETTGINIASDRIVEIAILKIHPDETKESRVEKINPTIPIPIEASQIHGIYDKDVADKPTFSALSKELNEFLSGCDLAGYNSNYFDIPILIEEFYRSGIEFEIEGRKCVDVLSIFKKMEQRNLTAAFKFYCGKDLNNAHSAEADTNATYEVLLAQLSKYDSLQNDVSYLHDLTFQNRNLDFEGKIIKNEKGVELINFGKHKGKAINELLKNEPSYFDWMLKQDFSMYTKKILKNIMAKYNN